MKNQKALSIKAKNEQLRSSLINVELVFNDSQRSFVPEAVILLAVITQRLCTERDHLKIKEKE